MFSYISYKKVYQSAVFLEHQNQFRPMSILSHTGDADFGYSWLVFIVRRCFQFEATHWSVKFLSGKFNRKNAPAASTIVYLPKNSPQLMAENRTELLFRYTKFSSKTKSIFYLETNS